MRKVFFTLLALASQLVYSQGIEILSIRQLPSEKIGSMYHPEFSPAGDFLLLSGENYAGLVKYDLSTGKSDRLTSAANAGYGVQISKDGQQVVYREASYKNNRKFQALQSMNLKTKDVKRIQSPTRDLTAHRMVDGTLIFAKEKKSVAKKVNALAQAQSALLVAVEDQKMVLYSGNARTVLSPNGQNASYIWPSISPDNRRIVYTVAGKGTFVCDLKGQNPVSLGHLGAPAWLGNGWIVGMDDKDDGHRLISSAIVAVRADGRDRQVLSNPSVIALYPTATADGTKVAFNSDKGDIYVMQVRIK